MKILCTATATNTAKKKKKKIWLSIHISSFCLSVCLIHGCAGSSLPRGMWDLPGPEIKPVSPSLAGGFFTREAQIDCYCCCCLADKSCPILCNPMNCSLPDFSVRGISQARILEWIAVSYSGGSSQPREGTWVSCLAGILYHWATWEALSSFF